ncbi:site-specific tyrosine recombinase XerC [Planctomycetes bacterium MalM25]|nr:site-specific tyrosine recombinase XerC [Planctomycetes bacterium MalM25]
MPNRAPKATRPPRVPSYCHHRASGQAYVKLRGTVTYLDVYGSDASRKAYAQVVAEVLAGRPITRPATTRGRAVEDGPQAITVNEICERYIAHARGYYVKSGKVTAEAGIVATACRRAASLCGDQPAEAFGPLALKSVRDRMVESGLARTTINGAINRIRRAFRWAAGEELIPASVSQALATVPGLRAGRTTARETAPVLPVDDATVDATLEKLPEVVADMVRLQRLTGMRPGEVCSLRPCDVDRSADVWTYRPASHKTEHHGRERIVPIGPQGQAVLTRYLVRDSTTYCFRPCDSEQKRRAALGALRVTPLSCGNRPGTNLAASPRLKPGQKYSVASYRQAIRRACGRAGVSTWHPNQLRHTAATMMRVHFGLEATQAVLGHTTARTSEIYAERNLAAGVEVARAIG